MKPIDSSDLSYAEHQPSIAQTTEFLDKYWEDDHADRWKSDKHEDVLFRLRLQDALNSRFDPGCYGWKTSELSTRHIAIAPIWYSLSVKGDQYFRIYRPKIILHELRKTIKQQQP